MKYQPKGRFTSNHIFVGNLRLNEGNNTLRKAQLDILKAHPIYKRLCEEGVLIPGSQEQKLNAVERAAKAEVKVVETVAPEPVVEEAPKAEPVAVEEEVVAEPEAEKPKRRSRRNRRKSSDDQNEKAND